MRCQIPCGSSKICDSDVTEDRNGSQGLAGLFSLREIVGNCGGVVNCDSLTVFRDLGEPTAMGFVREIGRIVLQSLQSRVLVCV